MKSTDLYDVPNIKVVREQLEKVRQDRIKKKFFEEVPLTIRPVNNSSERWIGVKIVQLGDHTVAFKESTVDRDCSWEFGTLADAMDRARKLYNSCLRNCEGQ